MASYLPPVNNYPIFDSIEFATGFIPLTISQINTLLCKYPTAQGTMSFTGSTSIIGTSVFNGPIDGTSTSIINVKTPTYTGTSCNATSLSTPLLNLSSPGGLGDSLTISSSSVIGLTATGMNHNPSSGFTSSGSSSYTYTNNTNTLSTYNNDITGPSAYGANLIMTTASTGGTNSNSASMISTSSLTSSGVITSTSNGVFSVPRLFSATTGIIGKYPICVASGSWLFNYNAIAANITITPLTSFNTNITYNATTTITSLTFINSLTSGANIIGAYITLFNAYNYDSTLNTVPSIIIQTKANTGLTIKYYKSVAPTNLPTENTTFCFSAYI